MAKKIIGALGAVFLVAGLAGFIGPLAPEGKALGLFYVGEPGILHNLVHILSGVVALAAAASSEAYARLYAKVFGAVYAVVTILGFFTTSYDKVLGLLPINAADNLLHLALTAVLLYVGFSGAQAAEGRAGHKAT